MSSKLVTVETNFYNVFSKIEGVFSNLANLYDVLYKFDFENVFIDNVFKNFDSGLSRRASWHRQRALTKGNMAQTKGSHARHHGADKGLSRRASWRRQRALTEGNMAQIKGSHERHNGADNGL